MRRGLFLSVLSCLLFVQNVSACRFWVAVGQDIPEELIYAQLVEATYSLKNLGFEYADGWSVGAFQNGQDVIIRGGKPAHVDENFEMAVKDTAALHSKIVMGHLRRASSGCVEGVANPHPFKRSLDGQTWLFAHNGGMKKQVLTDLIGEDYLNAHPPMTCTDDAPDSWIDSELYFIFLLKNIEESHGDVIQGLRKGLTELYEVIEEQKRFLNFFLTDGETVWVFRKGNSLFYKYEEDRKIAAVSSTVPNENPSYWKDFPEDTIAVLNPVQKIRFYSMRKKSF